MNHNHLPKEVLLPDWALRDKQGTKVDRVNQFEGEALTSLEVCAFL